VEQGLVERTRYYRDQGGDELGERFFDAAIASIRALEGMPSIGSPRVGELCDIPGLRSYRIEGFPTGWCYFVRAEHLDVVRLLAYAQDVRSILIDD
jgi:toxin ParE1/3/4